MMINRETALTPTEAALRIYLRRDTLIETNILYHLRSSRASGTDVLPLAVIFIPIFKENDTIWIEELKNGKDTLCDKLTSGYVRSHFLSIGKNPSTLTPLLCLKTEFL